MQFAPNAAVAEFTKESSPTIFETIRTPWGKPDDILIASVPSEEGDCSVLLVSTPSHGGMLPSKSIYERIPEDERAYAIRWSGVSTNGIAWFEEDCAVAFVIVAAPELFAPETVASARAMASWAKQKWMGR